MARRDQSGADRVLSIGEILIDFIVADGATSLAAAETFVARGGGAPANVAVALARLGVDSAFCGVAGGDPFGTRLRDELNGEGVDTARLRDTDAAATTLAYAWKDARGDGHFWLLRGADQQLSPEDIERAGVAGFSAIVVGSVSLSAQPSRSAIEQAVHVARQSAVGVVFDINLRPSLWADLSKAGPACELVARQSDVVKLSLDDAVGLFGRDTSPEQAIERVLALGPSAAVLTDGERGCWLASQDDPVVTHVPAFAVAAIEPTGAGDAFTGALVARALSSGWATPTVDDVRYAAAAGALATTRHGAWDGLPSRRQLDAFLETA